MTEKQGLILLGFMHVLCLMVWRMLTKDKTPPADMYYRRIEDLANKIT